MQDLTCFTLLNLSYGYSSILQLDRMYRWPISSASCDEELCLCHACLVAVPKYLELGLRDRLTGQPRAWSVPKFPAKNTLVISVLLHNNYGDSGTSIVSDGYLPSYPRTISNEDLYPRTGQ